MHEAARPALPRVIRRPQLGVWRRACVLGPGQREDRHGRAVDRGVRFHGAKPSEPAPKCGRTSSTRPGGRAKITLLSEDDNSDCNQSANATVKLITQSRVIAIIGADNSPCALAMVPLTQRYKVPQFTFGVGSAITQQGSHYVFRVAPAAPQQTKALANFVVNTLKKQRIAIMYSDDEYGASMATGLKQGLADLGLQAGRERGVPARRPGFHRDIVDHQAGGAGRAVHHRVAYGRRP